MQKNKGITLIALIITIVVILILVGITVYIVIGDSGPINQAKRATIMTELSEYKEALDIYKLHKKIENQEFIEESLNAGKYNLSYNTKNDEEEGNIRSIILNISDKYYETIEVIKGKLVLNTQDKMMIEIAQSVGIEANPYDIKDGV